MVIFIAFGCSVNKWHELPLLVWSKIFTIKIENKQTPNTLYAQVLRMRRFSDKIALNRQLLCLKIITIENF